MTDSKDILNQNIITLVNAKRGRITNLASVEYLKIEIECDKGHVFFESYNNLKKGYWCCYCNKLSSVERLYKILDNMGVEYTKNDPRMDWDVVINTQYVTTVIDCDEKEVFETDELTETRRRYIVKKCKAAINKTFRVIRIDYESIKHMTEIYNLFTEEYNIILMNPLLYHWFDVNDVKYLPDQSNTTTTVIDTKSSPKDEEDNKSKTNSNILDKKEFEEDENGTILGYCRVEMGSQGEQNRSLSMQREEIFKYAQKSGKTVRKIFADIDVTGESINDRRELRALLQNVKNDDELVVLSISILSESLKNTIEIREEIIKKEASIYIIIPNLKISSIENRELFMIMASFGEIERDSINMTTKLLLKHKSKNNIV